MSSNEKISRAYSFTPVVVLVAEDETKGETKLVLVLVLMGVIRGDGSDVMITTPVVPCVEMVLVIMFDSFALVSVLPLLVLVVLMMLVGVLVVIVAVVCVVVVTDVAGIVAIADVVDVVLGMKEKTLRIFAIRSFLSSRALRSSSNLV